MQPWHLIFLPFALVIFPPLGLILLGIAIWQIIGGEDGVRSVIAEANARERHKEWDRQLREGRVRR